MRKYNMFFLAPLPTVEPRLIFPAIQENASALSAIPAFLDTLGQKIDKSEREKDLLAVDQCLTLSHLNLVWFKVLTIPVSPIHLLQDKLKDRGFPRAVQFLVCNKFMGPSWNSFLSRDTSEIGHPRSPLSAQPRMATQMEAVLKEMAVFYDEMAAFQADAMVGVCPIFSSSPGCSK